MHSKQAYVVGALLMFGSAMWAALMTQDIKIVLALLAAPSLVAGYVYASSLPQYIWGALLGLCGYMAMEFQLYGPVYPLTAPVYAVGFVAAAVCAGIGAYVFCMKQRRINAG